MSGRVKEEGIEAVREGDSFILLGDCRINCLINCWHHSNSGPMFALIGGRGVDTGNVKQEKSGRQTNNGK